MVFTIFQSNVLPINFFGGNIKISLKLIIYKLSQKRMNDVNRVYSWYSDDDPKKYLVIYKKYWIVFGTVYRNMLSEVVSNSIREYKKYILYDVVISLFGTDKILSYYIFLKNTGEIFNMDVNNKHIVYAGKLYIFIDTDDIVAITIFSDKKSSQNISMKFHTDPLICLVRYLGATGNQYLPELVEYSMVFNKDHKEPMIRANGYHDILFVFAH